ncbi:MAG TPA: TrkH family potassium uptake protein [Hyphomonas sp.]|nr:cation transporter [Hyphomonas sp.]HRJ00308.1 TrkH family potassium uptake protein [Hyphomonas sp.]HRK68348.1 TrkH family potassium uptake protein [Hyphomonas sp.]
MQLRPVILALGLLTVLLAVAMLPCALIDLADGNPQAHVFVAASSFSALLGGLCWVLARGGEMRMGQREAFLLTVIVWVMLPAVAAIPFVVAGHSVTDSIFESVSGITTTGATVFSGLDDMPRGILLWRSILQWIGGIGIIVTAVAILPQLRVGGMQLFSLESSDMTGKFLPRVSDIAAYIGYAYLIISSVCALLYGISGMNWFDAINHSMTTVSAGGFSTYDASFGHFNGTPAILVSIVFMAIAAMPISLFAILFLQGRIKPLIMDPQPRLFLALALSIAFIIVLYHELHLEESAFESTWRAGVDAVFNVVSVISGTGYANAAYDTWGNPIVALFLIATFLGGCAGSASCGIKMFRVEITAKAIIAWSQRMVQPHRRAPIRYGGRVVDEETLQSVMVFLFLYLVTFMTAAAALSFTGLDPLAAISASATSVSNVGPGLGPEVGPSTTFASLTDAGKWICSIAMLLGRLEFVAVFVVLTPRFWRG